MAVKGGIEIIKALARKLITRGQTGIKRIPTQMEAEGEAGAIAAQIQQATGLRPSQLDEAIKSEEQVLSILNDLEYRSALSKQKESLKEFTKKEDVYEGMIDPKSDLGKKLAKLRRRGDETEPKTELIKKPPSPKKKEGIPIFADPIQQQGLNFFRSLGNKKLPVEQRVYGPFGKGTDGFRNMMLWMMQNTPEKTMEVMKQYGYKPKLVPKPKTELIKKEDVYEGMIDPKFPKSYLYTKKDGTKVKMTGDENLDYDYVETPEGYQIVPGSEGAFYRFGEKNKELIKKGSETEQQLKLRMERENKEAAERIRKKKAEESKTDPDDDIPFAQGGRAGFNVGGIAKLLNFLQGKLGKKAITTADKIARPESALNREMFGEFNERVNREILDVPPVPKGFQLSREKLLKNYPEIDESFADKIMAMDKDLQGRIIKMIEDRRKNPKAYDKLLMEKGDTLDFQGEFDRSVQRSKNADGGIAGQLHLNQGGRARFDKGGMNRRGFLKLMGGLAALPVVGKFFKFAKPTAKVVEAVKASDAAGMPAWFPKLVDKVIKEGEEVSGDLERVITHKAKLPNSKTDVYVTQDLTTGDTLVDIGMGKHGWSDGWNGQPVRMQLKKGEVIQEGQFKGKKSKDEFDIEEAEFTGDAESVKYEDSSFSKYGEQGSDFSEVEKYATGKVSKESKAQKQIWEADWDDSLPDEDFAKGGLAGVLKL